MVNNLMELARSGEIAITGAKPKLPTTIPNLTDTMLDVYRIPLKYLMMRMVVYQLRSSVILED